MFKLIPVRYVGVNQVTRERKALLRSDGQVVSKKRCLQDKRELCLKRLKDIKFRRKGGEQ